MKITDDCSGDETAGERDVEIVDKVSDSGQQQQRRPYDGGILTIGCCGLSILHLFKSISLASVVEC